MVDRAHFGIMILYLKTCIADYNTWVYGRTIPKWVKIMNSW